MEVTELMRSLKRLSEECICTVCLGPLYRPVSVCTAGHGFCPACLTWLRYCPSCKAPFTSQSVLLNSMLELIPRCCEYDGCYTFVKPGDGHERWCGFQPVSCEIQDGTCPWTGCGNDYINHVYAEHKKDIWQSDDLCWYYLLNHKRRGFEIPFKALDRLFLIRGSFEEAGDRMIIHFILVPNGTQIKSPIKIMFLMGSEEMNYTSRIMLLNPEQWLREKTIHNRMIFGRRSLKKLRSEKKFIPVRCQMKTVQNET